VHNADEMMAEIIASSVIYVSKLPETIPRRQSVRPCFAAIATLDMAG
jgi:hypothetical protein